MVMGPYFQERANVFKDSISAYQKSKAIQQQKTRPIASLSPAPHPSLPPLPGPWGVILPCGG